MNAEQIIKLIEAGFTRDDIMKLAAGPKPAEEKPAEEPKPEEKQAEEKPAEEPKPADLGAEIATAIKDAMKPFEDMYNTMSKLAGMPAIDNIQPKGVDDILTKFFEGE